MHDSDLDHVPVFVRLWATRVHSLRRYVLLEVVATCVLDLSCVEASTRVKEDPEVTAE